MNEQTGYDQKPKRRCGCLVSFALVIAGLFLIATCVAIFEYWEHQPGEPPVFQRTETDSDFHVLYEWSYEGSRWEYEAQIPKSAYQHFSSKQRTASYREYVVNPLDDEWMNHIGDLLSEEAKEKGWGEWETVNFVLSFVQNMPYTSDEVTTGYDEYPRYPVETIVDGGGDCEDTSILFASIVREMGYGVVLLRLREDHHIAVGVRISSDLVDNWQGPYSLTYYALEDGGVYAYCETTGQGWELGHKPDDMISPAAQIIDVL